MLKLIVIATICLHCCSATAGMFELPSIRTMQAVDSLKRIPSPVSPPMPPAISPRDIPTKDVVIDADKRPQSPSAQSGVTADGKTKVPFVIANSMIVQFQPDLTEDQIQDYLKSNNFEVVKTFSSIGAVQIKTDLSKFYQARPTDNNANDAVIRGFVESSAEFMKDPRVRAATPDTILTAQATVLANLSTATGVVDKPSSMIKDWGIADIQADWAWKQKGASDGAILGVMDVGFGRHSNLVYLDFLTNMPVHNHGTHVAGIACGRHGALAGAYGVLPSCFVRAQYPTITITGDGGAVLKFIQAFGQILTSLQTFVESYDDLKVINVSLGLNWVSNFSIDINSNDAILWRTAVDAQGPMLATMLQKAQQNGKIIVSAAGNDSENAPTPFSAKYSSPLNWAAIESRKNGITSAVIVEAHDQSGRRAPFSNIDGDLSCPGVDIMSTLAFDSLGQPSDAAYGQMSGTSMASPYCAAGILLFRLIRPSYSSTEAVTCVKRSSVKSDSGVPMLRLADALTACP